MDHVDFGSEYLSPENVMDNEPMGTPQLSKAGLLAMSRAIENPLIIQRIAAILDFNEMKKVRRLNSTWRTTTSKLMLRRDLAIIRIVWDHQLQVHRSLSEKMKTDNNLSDLNKILENFQNQETSHLDPFPCSMVALLGFHWTHPDIQKLLLFHGPFIKTLYVGPTPEEIDPAPLGPVSLEDRQRLDKMLAHQLPNLENLTLTWFYHDPNDEVEDLEFVLPALKSFGWMETSKLAILKILNNAPRLASLPYLEGMDPMDFQIMEEFPKTGQLIKHFSLAFSIHSPGDLQMLATLKPAHVTHLNTSIEDDLPSFRKEFESILQTCSSTLEVLEWGSLGARTGMKFLPPFPKVRKIIFGEFNWIVESFPIFPPLLNLLATFPHLHTLDCSSFQCFNETNGLVLDAPSLDEIWYELFPPEEDTEDTGHRGCLDTVKRLKVHVTLTQFWMTGLGQLCPNFEELVVLADTDHHCETTFLPIVFRLWGHLTVLKLKVKGVEAGPMPFYLDDCLTAIPRQMCHQLRTNSDVDMDVNEKTGPSIVDLRRLKSFVMKCYYENGTLIPFSHAVTVLHGFRLMRKDLVVRFSFDHNKAQQEDLKSIYEALGSTVNIRHDRTWRNK